MQRDTAGLIGGGNSFLVKRCDGTPNRSRAAGHDCAVAL